MAGPLVTVWNEFRHFEVDDVDYNEAVETELVF